MDYVIFSIDKWYDLHTMAKFTRYMDTLRSMGKLKGKIIPTIGCYEDQPEVSFICMEEDFYDHIFWSGYLDNQESFLYVAGDKHMTATIQDRNANVLKSGRMKGVGALVASEEASWTYRPDLNQYYILT